jgi:hypothetical protein
MRESRLPGDGNFALSLTLLPCGDVGKAALAELARALSAQGIDVRIGKQEALRSKRSTRAAVNIEPTTCSPWRVANPVRTYWS